MEKKVILTLLQLKLQQKKKGSKQIISEIKIKIKIK